MKYYVVDAFAKEHYHGNPAGICLLDQWLDESLMQSIAFENNLAETAFLVKREGFYELRWFTPESEIDLCGHATLASAHIIMSEVDPTAGKLEFHTMSGILYVSRTGDRYTLDFPTRMPEPYAKPVLLEEALGVKVLETYMSRDLLAVLETENAVRELKPDFELLERIPEALGLIVTARGTDCDFVSRYFAPGIGINEDPVTGSSHTNLIPFWSRRLNKKELVAKQLSRRGGTLYCHDGGERVYISGYAVTHLIGEIVL